MYWLASGFIFRRTDSVFHRLDPRVKLLISMELFVTALAARNLSELVGVLTFMFVVSALAKVMKRVARTMLLTATFAVFIFVVNIVFTRQIETSALYSTRFVAIVVSTSLFFITTSPDELEQVMKSFRMPRDVVFAFVTAVRFIPVMMLDALNIMDAQKSRGLELEKGNLVKRVRNMIPILIPLVVNSVVRSGELAEAMESRAYGAVARPTSLYTYRLGNTDKVTAIVSTALFALSVYAFYFVIPASLP